MKQLLYNANILTMNDNYDAYENGYLVIQDNVIQELGEGLPAGYHMYNEKYDCGQGILIPGMVNTHTHVGMIPFRSLADDVPNRLERFLFPLENRAMTADLAYASAKYAAAEMQLAGVTTFSDMYYFEDDIASAVKEMGSRAILAETIIKKSPDTTADYETLDYAEYFIQRWLEDDLITPGIAPHAPYTNSTESLQKAAAISHKYNVPIMMHVSEMEHEMVYYAEQYQMSPVAYLDSIGLLNNRFIAAHCIHLNSEDIQILKHNQVGVAHCIGANTKSAKGVAPVKELINQEVNVGLGTDGPSSGNTLDMFTQMRMVANFHKTYNRDRSAFTAQEIVGLATIGGARVLNMADEIGSLEVGKKADICLVETQSVNMFPVFDPYSALVYSANAGNVEAVWINGAQRVLQKQLAQHDLRTIRSDLDSSMSQFKVIVSEL